MAHAAKKPEPPEADVPDHPRDSDKESRIIESIPARFALLMALIFGAEIIAMALIDVFLPGVKGLEAAIIDAALLSVLISVPAWFMAVRPLVVELRAEQGRLEEEHQQLAREVRRRELDGRLHRALDMADTEPEALGVLKRAICHSTSANSSELLLEDSSRAHLRQAAVCVSGDDGCEHGDGTEFMLACPVVHPDACPAARQGRTLVFPDSAELDACPRMAEAGRAHSAACVPVSIGGRTVGVLRATGAPGDPPSEQVRTDLEVISAQAGARLGMLRAMQASSMAAATDPLTGLCNRRSLDDRVGPWLDTRRSFAVVMADLDHFKALNDTHSHATGDRALKTFARAVSECCRPTDVLARVGGEEFVLALPDVTGRQAADVMERLRRALPTEIAKAGVPIFTASFGIADSSQGSDLEGLMKIADEAMYVAKRTGRDRVVIAGLEVSRDEPSEPGAVVRSLSEMRAPG